MKRVEHLREHRHDARHEKEHERQGGAHDHRRVREGGANLLAQVGLALEQACEPVKHVVEDAARLTSADHGDVHGRKHARPAGHGDAQRDAVLDVGGDRLQRLAQDTVVRPFDRYVQRAPHRDSGPNQG